MNASDIEVTLVVNTTIPLTWSVEALNIDGDGGGEIAIFSGRAAEQRAREYAGWRYGVDQPDVMAA